MTNSAIYACLPMLIVAIASVAVLIAISIKRNHRINAAITVLGLAAAFVSIWPASTFTPIQVTVLLSIDRYALVYMGLVVAACAAVVLLSFPYLEDRPEHKEEFYLLLLIATLGSMVLAASSHMASFFLGLETLSISLYTLISYPRVEQLPLEAGIKYLVLAASSSAFLLFGLALIYLTQGTMMFAKMNRLPPDAAGGFAYLSGIVLVVTGIGFKLAVVPFHLWTPDVYQGAPLPTTAFIATASKGGVFAFFLRWLRQGQMTEQIVIVLAVIAIASMLVGNLLALRQTNIKRLLAYSSIAHMGYFFVALVASGSFASAAATYYLTAYIVTILGAFGSLIALSSGTRETERFDDVRGLFWRRPVLSSVFTAMILSLAGIPLTAGFLGKFYVLAAGASATAWTLIIVLIVSSTIGLVYYLRIIVAMFTEPLEGTDDLGKRTVGFAPGVALTILTGSLFVLGVYPGHLWNVIRTATQGLG